jgi:4-amino-4-deoxy-L-arabinose transferase-like glycosyltransferase
VCPRWLPAIVALAVALRLAHLYALAGTPWWTHLVVDPEHYDAWAQRIAAGDWLGQRAFYMDPLYPYTLAVLYRWWGRDLLAARLLNVAWSGLTCALVWRLGRHAGGRRVGALAALGFALYKPDVFHTGELDKTSLSIALASLALVLSLGRSLPSRLSVGVTAGLAALTRANFLLFAPLGALALLLDPRDRGRRVGRLPRGVCGAALFGLGFAAAILPVTWRNHHVSGEWVLTTSQAGQNFYTGNNPDNPYGAYGVVRFVRPNPHFEEDDFRAEAERRAGRALGVNEVSAFWFREGLRHIRDAPALAARAIGYRLVLFWNDFELSDSQDQYLLARDSWVLRLPLPGFGLVAALAVLGTVLTLRRRRVVRLLTGFVLVYWVSLAAFFLFSRYRIQAVPALLPLAALGGLGLARAVRMRDPRRLAVRGAIVALAALFCFQHVAFFWPEQPRLVEMRLRHLADVYLTAGDADRAIAALQEGVAPCVHGCPWALNDLYEAYLRTGRLAEGEAWFRRFVETHPGQHDAPGYLAEIEAGRRRQAGGPKDH